MGRDEREMSFAGRKHHDPTMDVPWAVSKPYGNWAIRSAGIAMRAGLRRCASRVTFDLPSFEQARAAVLIWHLDGGGAEPPQLPRSYSARSCFSIAPT